MNITRKVLDDLKPQLSDRDLAIIEDVGRFKLVTAGQLERLYFDACSDKSRARNRQAVLRRLTNHRVLARVSERRVGGARGGSSGYIYTLDVAGQQLAQVTSSKPRRPYVWYEPNVLHYLAVTELYVQLVETDRAGKLKLLAFETEPYCWRTFGSRTLKPDAFTQIGVEADGRRYKGSAFIEVDRGDQWGAKIANKFPQYLDYWHHEHESPVFPRVLLLAPTDRRVTYLERLIEEQGRSVPIFQAGRIDTVLDLLTNR